MVVAENRLSSDLIREGLLQHAADWPPSMLHYQDARGIPELRAALAHMVQRTFMKVSVLFWAGNARSSNICSSEREMHAAAMTV